MSEQPSKETKLVVGQVLWYVPVKRRGDEPYEVTVTKVGRKWATANFRGLPERIDMETLRVDGGGYSSPGACWLSKQDYEAYLALQDAWAGFRKLIEHCYYPPAGVTLNQIENAKRSLFKGAA